MNEENKDNKKTERTPADPGASAPDGEGKALQKLLRWMDSLNSRQNIIFLIAGAYLAYTGYSLVSGVLKGDAAMGFMAGGIAFILIGVFMAVTGGRGMIKQDKLRRAEEEKKAAEERETAVPTSEKKSMSISERARLAGREEDEELQEKPETDRGQNKEQKKDLNEE